MTCIVGIAAEGKVFMGADSAGVGGYDIANRKDVKVFKSEGLVIGCTSSFRMIQLLQYQLHPPKRHPDTDVMKYMVTDFVEAVRTCFRNGGFMKKEAEVEQGGCFLVGCAGRLFQVHGDFQVAERADGFDACGCGESYALGALASLPPGMAPLERLNYALSIAERFSAGVRGPFVFEEA